MILQTKYTVTMPDGVRRLLSTVVRRLGSLVSQLRGSPYPRLDPDGMGAHMQRDLGFLDGRDPRYERAETR